MLRIISTQCNRSPLIAMHPPKGQISWSYRAPARATRENHRRRNRAHAQCARQVEQTRASARARSDTCARVLCAHFGSSVFRESKRLNRDRRRRRRRRWRWRRRRHAMIWFFLNVINLMRVSVCLLWARARAQKKRWLKVGMHGCRWMSPFEWNICWVECCGGGGGGCLVQRARATTKERVLMCSIVCVEDIGAYLTIEYCCRRYRACTVREVLQNTIQGICNNLLKLFIIAIFIDSSIVCGLFY